VFDADDLKRLRRDIVRPLRELEVSAP